MKSLGWLLAGVIAVASVGVTLMAAAPAESKIAIKDVMKEAMKGELCKKVASGQGTDADKARLVELFTALHADKPKKGGEDSWKEKTDALLKAAADVKAGKEGGAAALKAAADCMGCHKVHK